MVGLNRGTVNLLIDEDRRKGILGDPWEHPDNLSYSCWDLLEEGRAV
jgi:hypothetical protein